MTALLPDLDALVRKALDADPRVAATVWNLWPDDWYAQRPLVVARRTPGGGDTDPRFYDTGLIDVQACAATRAAAGRLAREAHRALWDACRAQFSDAEAGGYLSAFADEFGGPAELRTGTAAVPHADAFTFQASFTLQARPLPVLA